MTERVRGSRRRGARRAAGRKRLRAPRKLLATRAGRYLDSMLSNTLLLKVILAFVGLWLLFSVAFYFAARGLPGSRIDSYGDALYWTVAAFSTAGIADTPEGGLAQLIGAVWIVVGSILFFGTIVATITSYFMRPLQRPVDQIIDTIEYNLDRIDELSVDELALLKKTSDSLILHMERLKSREQSSQPDESARS